MGGLRNIFEGMAQIVGLAENELAAKIENIASTEGSDIAGVGGNPGDGTTVGTAGDATGAGDGVADGSPIAADGSDGLQTQELLALQYDVQRFSIFNNMATSTMQTVAGAYQSVTGNLNFR